MVDEEVMRAGYWLGSVLCVPFSALTLMAGWQAGHQARKNTIPLILEFLSGTGGEGPEGEPADPDSPGKTAIK